MAVEDLNQRINIPTLPLDPADPARFAQLVETAKDCFQVELTRFFDFHRPQFQSVKAEVPTIEKYELGFQPSENAIETFTRILLQHPDITEKLPLVAITAASGNFLKLGFGSQYVDAVQLPARLKGTQIGPFALIDGDKISFRTKPDGQTFITSTILFKSQLFVNIGAATIEEVIAAANVQLLYVTAKKTQYTTPVGVLRLDAIGPLAKIYPNEIEILGPPFSTANALTRLGFVAGQKDVCASRPPANRYQLAQNLTIGIDLGAESENERREMTDLLNYFFSLEMDKRDFTFLGRWIFDDGVQIAPGQYENFQLILKDQHSLAGEAEIPRQAGSGEQKDLIYINRIQVPCTIIDYVDRSLLTPPQTLDRATLTQARVDSDGLPAGDHKNFGETSG